MARSTKNVLKDGEGMATPNKLLQEAKERLTDFTVSEIMRMTGFSEEHVREMISSNKNFDSMIRIEDYKNRAYLMYKVLPELRALSDAKIVKKDAAGLRNVLVALSIARDKAIGGDKYSAKAIDDDPKDIRPSIGFKFTPYAKAKPKK